MSHYETNAITAPQALTDLRTAAGRIREFAAQHPGGRLECQVLLTLPEPDKPVLAPSPTRPL